VRPFVSDDEASVLEAAIWFHDAVYDPQAPPGVNECNSADLLYPGGVESVPIHLVYDMIMSTSDHQIPDYTWEHTHLFSYFLDIDLAILGRSEAEYLDYTQKIRREYAFLDENTFREGRRRILLGLLARDQIYLSQHFRDKYEQQARRNVSDEILTLVPERSVVIHDERTGPRK